MVDSVTELNSLQLYLHAYLSYLRHSRCCDIPNLDICEKLSKLQFIALCHCIHVY